MKYLALLLAPALGLGLTAAMAQTALPDISDTDASGAWSLTELQAVWPELTEGEFAAVDANADGSVDIAELTAAIEAGTLTVPAQ
ncbi:MAG: EF-hand domain-containing protein [Paracoccaceae bacterium]